MCFTSWLGASLKIVLTSIMFSTEYEDVIYLKNGSIIYGTIVDLKVNDYCKIKIGENVFIGNDVVLYPNVVIGNDCKIDDYCMLHPNVTLYRNTEMGRHVIVHAGTVIGADGFGYTLDEKGCHYKINQFGRVVIEDFVEIGANSCIDRAAMDTTLIKAGTKIDNLVQVAHNCTVGNHSILVAQVGLAGSCRLGHHVVLAGQVGLADHVTVGNQVTVTAKSGTFRDLENNAVVSGWPAVPTGTWKRYVATLPKLPDLARKVKELESRLREIENAPHDM